MNARALTKKIDLRLQLDNDVDLVTMDPSKIQRVIYNLVDNSLHHTPENGAITVKMFRRDDNDIQVNVRNSGQHIEAEHLPYIFQRFYRAEGARITSTRVAIGGQG